MNSVRDRSLREIEEEVMRFNGLKDFRPHALQQLVVKTVVKESHKSRILEVSWNRVQADLQNLFATVGGDQATVYDDRHMGDHIAVVVNFSNVQTPYHSGGNLRACCWISAEGITQHPHGDACLAVSGLDSAISIISVSEARVVSLLKGHDKEVVEMSAPSGIPELLCSLSTDGSLRLWDVPSNRCLISLSSGARTFDISPCGGHIITGHVDGSLKSWPLHILRKPISSKAYAEPQFNAAAHKLEICAEHVAGAGDVPSISLQSHNIYLGGCEHGAVACVRFLPGSSEDRILVKFNDGLMGIWKMKKCSSVTMELVCKWQIPGEHGVSDHEPTCPVSFTSDGAFLCTGTRSGDIYIYSSMDGHLVGHVCGDHVKRGNVQACLLSDDCRHLLAAVGSGFLFRFEFWPLGTGGPR